MDILNLQPNEEDEYAEDAEIEAEEEEEAAGLLPDSKIDKITKRKSFKVGLEIGRAHV